ncbi:MAG TPA: GyrI-like domain-containing protein [Candidatus Kapabacteria bacterium]|nr:GyrI-like domain-containing protein [Candidatus Kapabacteria bacterium]
MPEIITKTIPSQRILSVTKHSTMKEFMSLFDEWYPKMWGYIAETGVQMAGAPLCIYHDFVENNVVIELGMPIANDVASSGDMTMDAIPGGMAAYLKYTGPYSGLQAAWMQMREYVGSLDKQPKGPCWEVYRSDPRTEPDPSKLVTEIYWLLE